MSNSQQVIAVLEPVFADTDGSIDEGVIDRFVSGVAAIAEKDFVTEMISVGGVAQRFAGAEGMRAGLADWTEAFSELRFEGEEVRDVGENVLTLAQQIAVTRQGVQIEQPSAVVWKFRDGRIYRVEWHMDRAAAERSSQSGQE